MHLIVILATLLLPFVLGNVPFYEPQMLAANGGGDWNMSSPFVIPLNAAKGKENWQKLHPFFRSRISSQTRSFSLIIAGYSPTVNTSRAFMSILDKNDTYDVITFNVTAGQEQYITALYALTPGCDAFKNFYPSIALLGPLTDPRFKPAPTDVKLPFEIPKGYGIIIKQQPEVSDRVIFSEGPVMNFYLPSPLNQTCLNTPELLAACDPNSESIINFVPGVDKPLNPGKYYIVWWDPNYANAAYQYPMEAVINVGTIENITDTEHKLQQDVITGQVRPLYAQCLKFSGGPPPSTGPSTGEAPPPVSGSAAVGLKMLVLSNTFVISLMAGFMW